MTKADAIKELAAREEAKTDFLLFIKYTKRDFIINWHHEVLAHKLQDFSEGRIKKLMIYLPPLIATMSFTTKHQAMIIKHVCDE